MSSLEIAELTGKEHKNVMRDTRTMFEALGVTGLSFGRSYRDSTGRTLPCFHHPKREYLILLSGYSVELRAAIIDRRQELEAWIDRADVSTSMKFKRRPLASIFLFTCLGHLGQHSHACRTR